MVLTARLRLRSRQPEDLSALGAILGDPCVMAFSDAGPLDRSAQSAWLQRARTQVWVDGVPGTFAIETRATGDVVGYVSVSRDEKRLRDGELELGFRLARPFWGRGYAKEAVEGLLHAIPKTDLSLQIVAIVDPHNHRSLRVLKKLGFRYVRDVMFEGYDYPDHVYACGLSEIARTAPP